MKDARTRYTTIILDGPDIEQEGIIWVQTGGGNKSMCPAILLGRIVKSYVDELEDGESVGLEFRRMDMTRAQINAIPET